MRDDSIFRDDHRIPTAVCKKCGSNRISINPLTQVHLKIVDSGNGTISAELQGITPLNIIEILTIKPDGFINCEECGATGSNITVIYNPEEALTSARDEAASADHILRILGDSGGLNG